MCHIIGTIIRFTKHANCFSWKVLQVEMSTSITAKNVCISNYIKSVERCWKYHISLLYHQLSIKLEIQSLTNFPIFGTAKFLHLSKLEMNWKCIIGNMKSIIGNTKKGTEM